MCGIVGWFSVSEAASQAPTLLKRMLAAVDHRGPDEMGYYWDNEVGLGNARLSIIDLSHGTQPMSSADRRFWIVYNGEIFNYIELREELEAAGAVFRTQSDTEVLLNALVVWGRDALPKLNGQFAFLFYDKLERTLLAARDPIGERPFFYMRHGDGYIFASEIKSIFSLPFTSRQLSLDSIKRLSHFWTNVPNETCFAGVRALPPGHYAVIKPGAEIEPRPYYRLPVDEPTFKGSFGEAKELVQSTIRDAVRIRLRSDVPVVTYASGGLDSSVITYLAQELSPHVVRSFSITFEDERFDESPYQLELADHLGTDHHVRKISLDSIADNFADAIWHTESSLFRTAPVPMFLLSQQVRRSGFKVALTGEASDEAFLGYNIFKDVLFRTNYKAFADDAARVAFLGNLYPYLPHFNERSARVMLGLYSRYLEEQLPGLFSHEMRFSNGQFAARAFAGEYDAVAEAGRLSGWIRGVYPELADLPSIVKAQLLEYLTLLSGYLLSSQGDRMSAANSVEGRCVYCDPNIIRVAFSMPIDYRLKDSLVEKHVLREAYREALPGGVTDRSKHAYRAPDAKSFVGGKPNAVKELLLEEHVKKSPLLNGEVAWRLVRTVSERPADRISIREDQAFVLVLSTLVLQQSFVDSFPSPDTGIVDGKLVREVDGREGANSQR